ncbi:hypothetical protein CXB49_21820 [Chromobacterium sp. ATCC 53434]|uniref:hypothetical protein n=1 Tax=Chromobacterium TaxID=535 RepID=UPI000C777E3D|nr:hypothetical protein [Chromobacterium sp. ATCC 53434]AUH53235.1 hypothetical protein CXB49_21820 [Chromobacterium sp. ATCC 53434]
MVSEFFIGLKVGATLSGVFDNAFRSARAAMDDLRKCSLRLSDAQKDLAGNVERTRRAYAGLDLARLDSQHRRLESTLGRLTRQHEAWQASLRRGQALKATLNLQQTRRIEILTSVRLSAVIRLVEEKVDRQRREHDKARRDRPSADRKRPAKRGGKGGERKGGDGDAAASAKRGAAVAKAKRKSAKAAGKSKPGKAVAEAKRKSAKPAAKSKPGKAVTEAKKKSAKPAAKSKPGKAVAEAKRKSAKPAAKSKPGKAVAEAKKKSTKPAAKSKPGKVVTAAKKKSAKPAAKSKPGKAVAATKKKSAKPAAKSKPGQAVAGAKRKSAKSGAWLDKAIKATDRLKRGSELGGKLSGGAAKALRTDIGRKLYEKARAKLNPMLGDRLPDTDRALELLDKGTEYSETASKYLGKTGAALKAYRNTKGGVVKKLLAAGAGFLKDGDDEKDGESSRAAKGKKAGAKKAAARSAVKPGAALKEARAAGSIGKTLGGARGLLKGALHKAGAVGDVLSLGMDLAAIRQSKLGAQAKSAAYGKALGGAAGSVAGGAAGAALGSLLGPVGTLVGQQAGSWLGQKGGEWLGEKAGAWWGRRAAPPKPVTAPKPVATAKPTPKPVAKPQAAAARSGEQARQTEQLQRIRQAAGKTSAKTAGSAAVFNITFSPQITVNGASSSGVKQQVQQAMQLSFAEFERLMKRYEADRQRRSYAARA